MPWTTGSARGWRGRRGRRRCRGRRAGPRRPSRSQTSWCSRAARWAPRRWMPTRASRCRGSSPRSRGRCARACGGYRPGRGRPSRSPFGPFLASRDRVKGRRGTVAARSARRSRARQRGCIELQRLRAAPSSARRTRGVGQDALVAQRRRSFLRRSTGSPASAAGGGTEVGGVRVGDLCARSLERPPCTAAWSAAGSFAWSRIAPNTWCAARARCASRAPARCRRSPGCRSCSKALVKARLLGWDRLVDHHRRRRSPPSAGSGRTSAAWRPSWVRLGSAGPNASRSDSAWRAQQLPPQAHAAAMLASAALTPAPAPPPRARARRARGTAARPRRSRAGPRCPGTPPAPRRAARAGSTGSRGA